MTRSPDFLTYTRGVRGRSGLLAAGIAAALVAALSCQSSGAVTVTGTGRTNEPYRPYPTPTPEWYTPRPSPPPTPAPPNILPSPTPNAG